MSDLDLAEHDPVLLLWNYFHNNITNSGELEKMSSANSSTVNSTIGQIVFYTISTIAINLFTGTEAGGALHCQILW